MKLRLVCADARKVEADVQFVKHFNGLLGGAEAELNLAAHGALESALIELDDKDINSITLQVQNRAIECQKLMILSLGDITQFTLHALDNAITHAICESIKNQFSIIATPVIGISKEVGLPLGRAYRTTIHSIITVIKEQFSGVDNALPFTDIIVFDFSPEKISYFYEITPEILAELDVRMEELPGRQFSISFEQLPRNNGCSITKSELKPTVHKNLSDDGRIHPLSESVKVLFLAANPIDTLPLRLDKEIREIDIAFRHAKYRNLFDIRQHGQYELWIYKTYCYAISRSSFISADTVVLSVG